MAARIPEEDLLEELSRLADELGHSPSVTEMRQAGKFSEYPYYDRFGSWNGALEAAGLPKNRDIPEEELLEALQELAADLGRSPTHRN